MGKKETELNDDRCRFCGEINGDENANLFDILFKGDPSCRILKESKNFVVMPTLGQIVEGYLLIVSKQHFMSMGHLPTIFFDELNNLKEEVTDQLAHVYLKPIFFEHGPVSITLNGGCCVEHAHLHAVPVNIDILDEISEHFKPKAVSDLSDLKKQVKSGIPYLFYEDHDGKKFIFDAPVVMSQFLRQTIAFKLGVVDRWDWRRYVGVDEIRSTIKKLSFTKC